MGGRVLLISFAFLITCVSYFLVVLHQQPVMQDGLAPARKLNDVQDEVKRLTQVVDSLVLQHQPVMQSPPATADRLAPIDYVHAEVKRLTRIVDVLSRKPVAPSRECNQSHPDMHRDLTCYKNRYNDLQTMSDVDAFNHFVTDGCKEGRQVSCKTTTTPQPIRQKAKGLYTPENEKLLRDHERSVEESGELQKLIAYAHEHYNISSMRAFFRKNGYLVFRPRIPAKTFEQALEFTTRIDKGDLQIGNFSRGHACGILKAGGTCIHDRYDNPGALGLATDWSTRAVIAAIYSKNPYSFQSLNYPRSSQAFTHSDYVHFGTYPPQQMCAVWFALEDIHPDSGPVYYYPESHKMPYTNMRHFGLGTVSSGDYPHYQTRIEAMAETMGFKRQTFTPRKGEVLLWDGNLLHGGPPPVNPSITRLSMVVHFYFYGLEYGWHPVASDLDNNHVVYANQVRVHQIWGRIPAHGAEQNKQIVSTCDAVETSPCKQPALSLGLKFDEKEGGRRCKTGHGYKGVHCSLLEQ